MNRYLLFDAGCSLCSGLARDIAAVSDGLLGARSLHDPEMQAALKRVRPGWRWEPTLLEVQGGEAHVFTGFALRAQLLAVLGPRRAWRVAQLVARAQTPLGEVDSSRRAAIKRGASFTAGIMGLVLLGPESARVLAQVDRYAVAASDRRPGPLSRREGVESWRVRRTGSGAVVTFEHKKRNRSGVAELNFSERGGTGSTRIERGPQELQIAINSDRGTFAGSDFEGRATSGSFDKSRRRWNVNAQSDRVLKNSSDDFVLALAIYSDLAPRPRRRELEPRLDRRPTNSVSQEERKLSVEQAAQCDTRFECPCAAGVDRKYGSNVNSGRSLACFYADLDVSEKCSNGFCFGCCRLYASGGDEAVGCDCVCALGDVICTCFRPGDPCSGECTCDGSPECCGRA